MFVDTKSSVWLNTEIPKAKKRHLSEWSQPDTDEILVDQHSALVERTTFEKIRFCKNPPDPPFNGQMWRSEHMFFWYQEIDQDDPSTTKEFTIIVKALLVLESHPPQYCHKCSNSGWLWTPNHSMTEFATKYCSCDAGKKLKATKKQSQNQGSTENPI